MIGLSDQCSVYSQCNTYIYIMLVVAVVGKGERTTEYSLENMWAAFPTSQWIQLKIGLFDESGCGRNAAKIGWKNAKTVVTTPKRAWVWLGPDTHSPSSTKMHADPAKDRIQVNIINRRCHCEVKTTVKKLQQFLQIQRTISLIRL